MIMMPKNIMKLQMMMTTIMLTLMLMKFFKTKKKIHIKKAKKIKKWKM